MENGYRYLLFDLDGTLTDPAAGITRSVSYALARFGIRVKDLQSLYPFIGPPLADSFREFYGFSPAQVREAIALYREYFSDRGIFENEPYPGVASLLEELQNSGKFLLLATSKPEVYARRILKHFDLASYFDFIGGATLDGSRNEKKDVIRHVLENRTIAEASPAAVMIGDRRHDILGARSNGLNSIGVTWGYGSREELLSAGATRIANSFEELRSLLFSPRPSDSSGEEEDLASL